MKFNLNSSTVLSSAFVLALSASLAACGSKSTGPNGGTVNPTNADGSCAEETVNEVNDMSKKVQDLQTQARAGNRAQACQDAKDLKATTDQLHDKYGDTMNCTMKDQQTGQVMQIKSAELKQNAAALDQMLNSPFCQNL